MIYSRIVRGGGGGNYQHAKHADPRGLWGHSPGNF